jgi:hypothetical protein
MLWVLSTARRAFVLKSDSKGPESASSARVGEVYSWASQLASETRDVGWVNYWYIWPESVQRILRQLETMRGLVIGLVGRQGVGKSAALQAIYVSRVMAQDERRRKNFESKQKLSDSLRYDDVVLLKWRREQELFKSLLDETHELSRTFNLEYRNAIWKRIRDDSRITDNEKYEQHGPGTLDLRWAEAKLGKLVMEELRREAWLTILVQKKVILIDMPDYSKTDRRRLAKDLEGIYWLWSWMANHGVKANVVIAIQKELFGGHFFLDKMEKVELEPLGPKEMVEAYRKRFKAIEPFTEDALLTLARMSRGVFRRFLRYITLTLTRWETEGKGPIDTAIVKEAVTVARLVEDMELELVELFPKQSELRLQAVRLLLLLEESESRKQNGLSEELGMEAYEMTRLLAKLELHHYVTRRREGNDKIVSLCKKT